MQNDATDKNGAEELDASLNEALRGYHSPPVAVPLGQMWRAIERAHFGAEVHTLQPRRSWTPMALAAAASLLLGVAIGYFMALTGSFPGVMPAKPAVHVVDARAHPGAKVHPVTAAQDPGTIADAQRKTAYGTAANDYLGQTVALLAVLPGATHIDQKDLARRVDAHFAAQATELLSTTRMLLDSPGTQDAELRNLLLDLELVLAQVASPQSLSDPKELTLINEALRQHDLMSRLQIAAVRTSGAF